MPISTDQLTSHLKRGLAPVYFIYGEEPLLVGESCQAIREPAACAVSRIAWQLSPTSSGSSP